MPGRNTEPKEKTDDLQGQAVRRLAFEAILAQNANAIRFHGESGAQVTFDVDDTGRDALKELVEYRGENLHIEVSKISGGS
jgi:hypothetical protein